MDPRQSHLVALAARQHGLVSDKHHAILRVIEPLHGRTDIRKQLQVVGAADMAVQPAERAVTIDEHRTLPTITSGTTDKAAAQVPFGLVEACGSTDVLDVFERDMPFEARSF